MRLVEPIVTTGFFWLPEDPDTRLPGVLRVSESSEITVELAGVFGNPLSILSNMGATVTPQVEEEPRTERIVGFVEKGGPVTLDGCLREGASFGLFGGLSKSTFRAGLAFFGTDYGNHEKAAFSELSFSLEGLDAWLGISGIDTEQDMENNSGLIRFRLPDDILLTLPHDLELKFAFNLKFPSVSRPMIEAGVKQTSFVFLKSRDPHDVRYFSSLAFRVCNFISFALDQSVCIQSMTGYLDQRATNGQNRRKAVEIYGQFPPWTERKPTIRWHDALFRYSGVADQLNGMMTRWFEGYETFEPAFNLYFASRTQSAVSPDTKVLWLTQAMEALHRKNSQATEMSESEFRNLLDLIGQSCPDDRRDWVLDNLRYANEPRFRRRVRELVEPFKRWFGTSNKERRDFINKVCDTRNYLTHYDEKTTRNRATDPEELFDLHEKMEALFQFHLLKLIGIDESSIDPLVQENARFRRRLSS